MVVCFLSSGTPNERRSVVPKIIAAGAARHPEYRHRDDHDKAVAGVRLIRGRVRSWRDQHAVTLACELRRSAIKLCISTGHGSFTVRKQTASCDRIITMPSSRRASGGVIALTSQHCPGLRWRYAHVRGLDNTPNREHQRAWPRTLIYPPGAQCQTAGTNAQASPGVSRAP